MTLRVFKEVGGGRILVALADRFPQELDRRSWRSDATGYPDNALSAQVCRDGYVLGRLIRPLRHDQKRSILEKRDAADHRHNAECGR